MSVKTLDEDITEWLIKNWQDCLTRDLILNMQCAIQQVRKERDELKEALKGAHVVCNVAKSECVEWKAGHDQVQQTAINFHDAWSDERDKVQEMQSLLDEAKALIEGELSLTTRIATRCAEIADGYIGCDCLAADIRKEFAV